MNRAALILGGLVVGLLGLLSFHALPWAVSDSSGDDQHFTYMRLAESGEFGETDGGKMGFGLALGLQGFLWGMALLGVGYLGILARPFARGPAATLALLGASAPVVAIALFGIGGTVFVTELADLSAAGPLRYSINYATPGLAILFAGLCAAQSLDAVGDVRRALDAARAESPYAPYEPHARGSAAFAAAPAAAPPASADAPAAAPAPAPGAASASDPARSTAPPLGAPAAPAPSAPLARERARALERIAQGRDHARGLARGTDDPAMAGWLRQTEAYLAALETRARQAQDAATLAAVERDVEEHVLRHG